MIHQADEIDVVDVPLYHSADGYSIMQWCDENNIKFELCGLYHNGLMLRGQFRIPDEYQRLLFILTVGA